MIVAETVVGHEVRVPGRSVARRKPVITQTGDDRQAVRQIEFVLDIDRVEVITPDGSRVCRVLRRGIVVIDCVRKSVTEIVNAVKADFGFRVLNEHIEDFQRF